MRIAILGAGFAGLAVTWYLLHYTKGTATIDLFDPEPIGSGASGLSSGLLHPYSGKYARRVWQADDCLKETHRLITVASGALARPLVLSKGILRPAITQTQVSDFQKTAASHLDTQWWDKTRCEQTVPGLLVPEGCGGLFIPEGLTIDSAAYLQGLWQACALLGTQFYQEARIKLSDLATYDKVLIAMGPMSKQFPALKELPITPVKGQILELKWPTAIPPLPFSLISQKYVAMSPDHTSCLVGSTFEHTFNTYTADLDKAKQDILPNILTYFPPLKDAEIVNCRCAFRASSPSHLPLLGQAPDKTYFFTALGSKGLLYHAWLGKMMARTMLSSDLSHIPPEVLHTL